MEIKNSKPKIFLTGASGFLGGALLKVLVDKRYNVKCFCRRKPALNGNQIQWLIGDFKKEFSEKILDDIDVVIHAAALSDSYSRSEFEKVNVDATKELVKASERAGIKKFIYISSISVKNGKSLYAASKRKAENFVLESSLNYVIFRPTLIFSSLGDPAISQIVRWIKLRIVPIIGSGRNNFQPVFLGDVADVILTSLEKQDISRRLYEIGGSDVLSYNDLVGTIAKAMNKKVFLLHLPRFLFFPFFYLRLLPARINFPDFGLDKTADNSLAIKELKFKPREFGYILRTRPNSDTI